MYFGGFGKGFPATKASGFAKAVPNFGKFVAPGIGKGGFGKGGFGKGGFGKGGFGKGGLGKGGFGKGGFGKGYPSTKSSGFNTVVPTTTVATSPFPGGI
jgi:hypothetical protein